MSTRGAPLLLLTELLGQGGQSFVTTDYTKRGTVKSVGGSYGTLVAGVLHDADGLPTRIEYGDLAKTTTDFSHDVRRRLSSVQTYRGPPVEWTSPPQSYSPAPNLNGPDKVFQSILEDGEYVYDEVDNPVEIRDHRNPAVWPAGAKPVTKKATYDDLYRLTKIRYEYASGDDTWVDPFEAETTGQNPDTRRATPSPHVSFSKRVLEQTYQYDWLGNLVNSGDDAKGFYDRSLGAQSHSGTKPYQLTSATGAVSPRDGNLTLAYDVTGNTTSMALVRNGACLPSTAVCSQRFAYDWDEVGRLNRARRWDLSSPGVATDPLPVSVPAVDLRCTYDASDSRVLKTAVDAQANELHTVYVFASLELRRATFSGGDFTDTKDTEVAYLFAHGVRLARLHYSENSLPTLTSGKLHVLLELPDHLGSSSIVLDKETGELAERSTFQAYGGADSDYRPDRWGSFREDYRFTGKEEDSEVGLDYFGKRYLAVGLNRWLSADPLAVHAPGRADLNLYAYVSGGALKVVDPVGLAGGGRKSDEQLGAEAETTPASRNRATAEGFTFAKERSGAAAVDAFVDTIETFFGGNEANAPTSQADVDRGKARLTEAEHAIRVVNYVLVGKILGTVAGHVFDAPAGSAVARVIAADTAGTSSTVGKGAAADGAKLQAPNQGVAPTVPKPPTPPAAVPATVRVRVIDVPQDPLAELADHVHQAILKSDGSADVVAQSMRTTSAITAIDATGKVHIVVASSEGKLTPSQLAALPDGVYAATPIPGVEIGHAEVNAINYAKAAGWKPVDVAASRPVCNGCAATIYDNAAKPVSPVAPFGTPKAK